MRPASAVEAAKKTFAEALAKAKEEVAGPRTTAPASSTVPDIPAPHVDLAPTPAPPALPEIQAPATAVKVPELPAIPVLSIEEEK